MPYVIEACAGHVHIFRQGNGSGGVGFYKLQPSISAGGGSRCLITGAPIMLQEIVQPVTTLDKKRFLYAYGSAWSEGSISGLLLLGESSSGGQAMTSVLDWYKSNRVSKKKGPVQLSAGGRAIDVYVVGLRIEAADPNFNTQAFSILVNLAENN